MMDIERTGLGYNEALQTGGGPQWLSMSADAHIFKAIEEGALFVWNEKPGSRRAVWGPAMSGMPWLGGPEHAHILEHIDNGVLLVWDVRPRKTPGTFTWRIEVPARASSSTRANLPGDRAAYS